MRYGKKRRTRGTKTRVRSSPRPLNRVRRGAGAAPLGARQRRIHCHGQCRKPGVSCQGFGARSPAGRHRPKMAQGLQRLRDAERSGDERAGAGNQARLAEGPACREFLTGQQQRSRRVQRQLEAHRNGNHRRPFGSVCSSHPGQHRGGSIAGQTEKGVRGVQEPVRSRRRHHGLSVQPRWRSWPPAVTAHSTQPHLAQPNQPYGPTRDHLKKDDRPSISHDGATGMLQFLSNACRRRTGRTAKLGQLGVQVRALMANNPAVSTESPAAASARR